MTAIGQAVRGPDGAAVAACSIAMPTARYQRARLMEWVGALSAIGADIERDLATATDDY